jgi:hypothetical protein
MTNPSVGELERQAEDGVSLRLRAADYKKYDLKRIADASAKGGATLTIYEAGTLDEWARKDISKNALGHVVFEL